MQSFLCECADFLIKKYGSGISGINILLPSRRARFFFDAELAAAMGNRPIWQPDYVSVDELMSEVSGLEYGNRIVLITELYKVYSRFHREDFDKFYHWGEMLITDFDGIDNYLISAADLLRNSKELEEIDRRFDDLSDREIIGRFWKSFRTTRKSEEKHNFLAVWDTLLPIYEQYREALQKAGIGYKGLVYRAAAQRLISQPGILSDKAPFAVIGFNALSRSEQILFDAIRKRGDSDFLWDSDDHYTADTRQEAGLFIRENVAKYGESFLGKRDNYTQPKSVSIIEAPSSAAQCSYAGSFLKACAAAAPEGGADRETAIILTDESLLLPILYSVPPEIEAFNATGGYPLRQTPAYTLFEYLVQLCNNKKEDGRFYFRDIHAIITHPLIRQAVPSERLKAVVQEYEQKLNELYFSLDHTQHPLLEKVFSPTHQSDQSNYLQEVFSEIGNAPIDKQNREFTAAVAENIEQLRNTLHRNGITLSNAVFISALRRHLASSTLPFSGEPLKGIQIMGILETRGLDFENVLILSLNEDSFPSNLIRPSYIPQTLRAGYGLPTPEYHEAMYAYYFYRLLQRAKRVELCYCAVSNGLKSGEPSRFINQIRYEKTHTVAGKKIASEVGSATEAGESVPKDEHFAQTLTKILRREQRLSPSTLFQYIECPMKFYFAKVAGIRTEKDPERDFDAADFGNVIHYCLDAIYRPLIGKTHTETITALKEALLAQRLADTVRSAIAKADTATAAESGAMTAHLPFITAHVKNVLQYDLRRTDGFRVTALEKEVQGSFPLSGGRTVGLYGKIDRIDTLADGTTVIIDYKTGSAVQSASTIESLFDTTNPKLNKPYFQTLLYCLLYGQEAAKDARPELFFSGAMGKPQYDATLLLKNRSESYCIDSYGSVAEEFESELGKKLESLFDTEIPIEKTPRKEKVCTYCDYQTICEIR